MQRLNVGPMFSRPECITHSSNVLDIAQIDDQVLQVPQINQAWVESLVNGDRS